MSNAIDNLRGGGTLNEYSTGVSSVVSTIHTITSTLVTLPIEETLLLVSIQITVGNLWSASGAWMMSDEKFLVSRVVKHA